MRKRQRAEAGPSSRRAGGKTATKTPTKNANARSNTSPDSARVTRSSARKTKAVSRLVAE